MVSYCQLIDGELSCLSWCCWILFLTWWHLTGPGHEEDLGWGMTTEDRHINLGKYEAAVKRKKYCRGKMWNTCCCGGKSAFFRVFGLHLVVGHASYSCT